MDSNELGRLFEHAASEVLSELFRCWGYEINNQKIQKSGSQHGFDIYYKIAKKHTRLNVFVECKASKTYNTIPWRELTGKIAQLSWAGFREKDVHLFFSPSRAVGFGNEQLTIEDDSYLFVIVDWMRKESGVSPALELFAAYRSYSDDPTVREYCDFLFSEIDPGFRTDKTFEEIGDRLKRDFDRRIDEHSAAFHHEAYTIINGSFWSQVQRETHTKYLPDFYTRTDSNPARLREVVANDFHVRNEKLDKKFARELRQAVKERAALVKILSKGGEGKSTFLYHIAKTHYEDHVVIWLENIHQITPADIEKQIRRLDTDTPLLFLLDNAAVYGRSLVEFARQLTRVFRRFSLVFIVAEREFRYRHIEDVESVEAAFNETHEIDYRASHIREQVFDRLITHFEKGDTFSDDVKAEARDVFVEDRRKSLSEGTFAVIKYLKRKEKLKDYKFDWEDWESWAGKSAPALQDLYLILATFYQFGFTLDIDFCAGFLEHANAIAINKALGEHRNLPIYRRGNHLLLRHETIASWYLDGATEQTRTNQQNSERIFKSFLDHINTEFSRNLFIWLCLKNKDFKHSYLARYLDDEKHTSILENYINRHKDELKFRTELSKIYQKQKRWEEAEKLLKECLAIDPDDPHSLLELGKMRARDPARYKEAEQLFKRILENESDNLFAKIELAFLYRKMGWYSARERLLFEIYDDHPEDIPTLMALAQVFSRFRKYRVALKLLESALEIRKSDLLTLIALIRTHAILRDRETVNRYRLKGQHILKRYPYTRNGDRFRQLPVHIDDAVTLLRLNEVGAFIQAADQSYVEREGERYPLDAQATVNNRLKDQDKIYFATYSRGGHVFADFVEPYFEGLDDLYQLK